MGIIKRWAIEANSLIDNFGDKKSKFETMNDRNIDKRNHDLNKVFFIMFNNIFFLRSIWLKWYLFLIDYISFNWIEYLMKNHMH